MGRKAEGGSRKKTIEHWFACGEKTDYMRFIIHESDQAIIDFRHDMCRGSICKKSEKQCAPGLEGVPCSYIKRCMHVRDKAESNLNYYCAEIAAGRKSPSDPPRTVNKVIFKGYRREILYFIKELIKKGFIAYATDAQICALFYCTFETDNADFDIDNPVMLVWLLPGSSFAFMLTEVKSLDCFNDYHFFEQFKGIFVGRDLKPICDLSAKKDSAKSDSDFNQEILIITDKFCKLKIMNNEY